MPNDRKPLSGKRSLDSIEEKTKQAGEIAVQLLNDLLNFLAIRDTKNITKIAKYNKTLKALENAIAEDCSKHTAIFSLSAKDTRRIIAILKVSNSFTNIGSLIENTASKALTLTEKSYENKFLPKLISLGNHSELILRNSNKAFTQNDIKLAYSIIANINDSTNRYDDLFNKLVIALVDEIRAITVHMYIQTIAKEFETITNQCKTICEQVIYISNSDTSEKKIL